MTPRRSLLSAAMILSALLSVSPLAVEAQTTHYVAPKGASAACTGTAGSATCPWPSVAAALSSKKVVGGDALILKDGRYDRIVISGTNFTTPITIISETKRNAIVDTIYVRSSSGIVFQRLSVWGTPAYPFPLIRTDADTSRLVFSGLDLRSTEKVSDVLSWSAAQWIERRRHGIWLNGTNSVVANCTVKAVQSGIWSGGSNNKIVGNRITEFTGDALRAGNNTLVRKNYVANAMRVDNDHLDGFQAIASPTKPVTGLVINDNTILEWTHPQNHPLRTGLQAIGLFDGFYDDFVIENNVIAISGHHGISVHGGRRGKIVNNTVVQISGNPAMVPWIAVRNHKNGTPSKDVTVANNVAMAFAGASATNNIVFSNNQVILYPAKVFQDVLAFNYRPKTDSGMIDTANRLHAPKTDITGAMRSTQGGPDKGAYEVGAPVQSLQAAGEETVVDIVPTGVEKPTDNLHLLGRTAGRWLKP